MTAGMWLFSSSRRQSFRKSAFNLSTFLLSSSLGWFHWKCSHLSLMRAIPLYLICFSTSIFDSSSRIWVLYISTRFTQWGIEKRRILNVLGHEEFVRIQEIYSEPVLAPLFLALSHSKFVNPLSSTLIDFIWLISALIVTRGLKTHILFRCLILYLSLLSTRELHSIESNNYFTQAEDEFPKS